MRCRHSGHTGSREIFSRGKPQSRQSEGKKTENKLAAPRWTHPARLDEEPRGTIEGLRTSTGTPPARIRSSLLLKTASSRPAARTRPRSELLCYCSIAVGCTLGNVLFGSGSGRCLHGCNARNLRRALMYRGKNKAVIAAETFTAAHRLHQEERQDVTFSKSPAARAEPYFASAIPAVIRLGEPGIGRISHRLAPQKYTRSEELQTNRRENQVPTFYISPAQTKRAIGSFAFAGCANLSQARPSSCLQHTTKLRFCSVRDITGAICVPLGTPDALSRRVPAKIRAKASAAGAPG